jgi:hypothetical protein
LVLADNATISTSGDEYWASSTTPLNTITNGATVYREPIFNGTRQYIPMFQSSSFPTPSASGDAVTLGYFQSTPGFDKDLWIDQQIAQRTPLGESMPIWAMSAIHSISTNVAYYLPIWVPQSATSTGVQFFLGINGNYTAAGTNEIALYTYASGTLTKVATTGNVANLWSQGSSTWTAVPWTSTYALVTGWYWVGYVMNAQSVTTLPNPTAATVYNGGQIGNSGKYRYGQVPLQSSLPATQAVSGLQNNSYPAFMYLY